METNTINAEILEELEENGLFALFEAWIDNFGIKEITKETLEEFKGAYLGTYSDLGYYAQDLAEQMGIDIDTSTWPYTCIDWDQAGEELRLAGDITVIETEWGNVVHIFASF